MFTARHDCINIAQQLSTSLSFIVPLSRILGLAHGSLEAEIHFCSSFKSKSLGPMRYRIVLKKDITVGTRAPTKTDKYMYVHYSIESLVSSGRLLRLQAVYEPEP